MLIPSARERTAACALPKNPVKRWKRGRRQETGSGQAGQAPDHFPPLVESRHVCLCCFPTGYSCFTSPHPPRLLYPCPGTLEACLSQGYRGPHPLPGPCLPGKEDPGGAEEALASYPPLTVMDRVTHNCFRASVFPSEQERAGPLGPKESREHTSACFNQRKDECRGGEKQGKGPWDQETQDCR